MAWLGVERCGETHMNLTVLGTSITYYSQYDLSEIVSNVQWFTSINSQAGKLTFEIQEDKAVFYLAGDIIEAFADGKKFFKGKVFTRSKTKKGLWKITVYDNMRYLQSEDTISFAASTAAERFKKICEAAELPYKIGMKPSYKCAAVIADGKTYFSMLEDALSETRKGANNSRYTVFDDVGTLKFVALQELNTAFLLGDESLITDYSYESTIDDAYNSVKVVRENEKNKTRQIYSAKDSKTIATWGKLQKVESATDSDMNAKQLQQQANDTLKANNVETSTLSLDAVGNIGIRAGNSFNLVLSDLKREWKKDTRVALVQSCTHSFNPVHTMSMEVEVVY